MRFITSALIGFCAASLGIAAVTPSHAQEAVQASTKESAVHALLLEWEAEDGPGVAVLIVKDGQTVFQKGYGTADIEQGVAITENTAFHAASISKQFTAFAVLTLVDEGKLRLDDDVRVVLPELNHLPTKFTVAHLLDHMSGLKEVGSLLTMAGWLPDDIVTQHQQYSMITSQKGFNFEPAQEIEYSNTGYAVLAKIVEKVSGQPFEEHMRATIFAPLGMDDTMIQSDRSAIVPNIAYSYNVRRGGLTKSNLNREIVGSTGVITTVADLAKWAANFQSRTVGSERVFDLMEQRGMTESGEVSPLSRGQELRVHNGLETWSHGGRIAGFRSFLLRVPSENLVVAMLSNRSDVDPANLGFALTDIYVADSEAFEEPVPVDWSEATQAELDSYAGFYELFPGAIFDISNAEGKLLFTPYGTEQSLALAQSGKGQFVLNSANQISIRFDNEAGEQAQDLKYVIGLNGELTADRTNVNPLDPETLDLQDFTGVFFSEELQTRYILSVVDDSLVASHLRLPDVTLAAFEQDTFVGPGSGLQKVEFERDENGAVTGAIVSAALAENVVFRKVQ
ncbi:serine hydrolase [uncultured Erythrobacter sp.]|uniref:serine hydrolase domain-containing protein n=1 Tax=uncultured Erythrobacter sp. TaxID=263913 RepID=UPI00263497EB|nr:serine hydrolase domain-containing protein [uncultured Erythrobacter sp.]